MKSPHILPNGLPKMILMKPARGWKMIIKKFWSHTHYLILTGCYIPWQDDHQHRENGGE
jgi:hypothetical protein